MSNYLKRGISVFFEYDTPRIVHIKSKKVGVINRFLQLCIIGYIIGYALIYKKGYQEEDDVTSVVTTKLKGVVMVNTTVHPGLQEIWDVADYVVPPQENNAFFVITNLIVTPNQRIGQCPEDSEIVNSNCTSDTDCAAGKTLPAGNGVMTGKCNMTVSRCEINAWCPVEDGLAKAPNPPILLDSQDFTVFIKNNIEFTKFKVKRRNLPDNSTDLYLQTCRYNGVTDSRCPIFTLKSLVEATSSTYQDIALKGGVIQIVIDWQCDLDHSEESCLPEYKFRRLDSSNFKISTGFNFRFSKNFKTENGIEYRTLYKAYGIKFVLTVTGQARKFNLYPLIINLASGLALLSIATILCDIVVLYVLKARKVYYNNKYKDVVGDDAYKGIDDDDDDDDDEK